MDLTPYIGPAVTVIIAVAASWMGFSTRIAKLEAMLAELKGDVEKHNQVVERTYHLESNAQTAWKRHDELAERVDKIEERIDRLRNA